MPRNMRPSSYSGSLDYTWKDAKLYERENAQNIYDLLVAQEQANQLKQQELELKIQQELENEASKKSSIEAAIDAEDCTTCEKYNINYNALARFATILNYGNKDIQSEIIELQNKIPQYQTAKSRVAYKMSVLKQTSILILGCVLMIIFWIAITGNGGMNTFFTIGGIYTVIHLIIHWIIRSIHSKDFSNNFFAIKNIQEKINTLEKMNQEYVLLNYKDFNKFRRLHFNKSIEQLFSKLSGKIFVHFEPVENINLRYDEDKSREAYRKYVNNVIKNAEI